MEPEPLSTQESTFRLLKSLSLPNILPPSLPPADFLRAYSKLKNTRSAAMKALRMEHLKKVRIQAVDEGRFVKAIRHLEDVATMPRFRREYVELQAMKPASGFLEARETQYFVIMLSGAASPLHIDVRKDKGTATCFFSYKSLKPGPKIYDFSFKSRGFKIHSRFSFFKDAKAYLSVLPDQDTVITLTIAFGRQSPLEIEEQLAVPRASLVYSIQSSNISTPLPRNQLVFALSQPVRPAKEATHSLSQSVDFIEANKRLSTQNCSLDMREINENRHFQAKFRRAELEKDLKTRATELNERAERRASAVEESLCITAILRRKQRFEEMWLRLLAFATQSRLLYARFLGCKFATVRNLQKSMTCQRFQRVYRRKYEPQFSLSVRQTALAVHHFLLFLRLSAYHTYEQVHKRIFHCLLDTIDQGRVSIACLRTVSRVLRIQRSWKQRRTMEQHYFRHLLALWDRVIAQEEERRGRKGDKARRFIHINDSQKTAIIFKEMENAKQRQKDYLSRPFRASAHLISFLPKAADLRLVLLKWLKARCKKPVKSPTK